MLSTYKDDTISDPQSAWSTFVQSRLILTQGVSLRDKPGAAVRAQQGLDAELSALHLSMCAIRARHNALSPISSLPVEVLAHIFLFSAIMNPPVQHEGHPPLGWITVTHVCWHWRDVALHSPFLWNVIGSGRLGYKWVELILARTRTVPISIYWSLDKTLSEDRVDLGLISRHIHHTRHLTLWGMVIILLPFVTSQTFSHSILDTLELDGSWHDPDNKVVPELPANLVGARLPFLREVRLIGLCIPWSAPVLCGLTHLEITVQRMGDKETFAISESYNNSSCDELLSALENMPMLQVLILVHCLPRRSRQVTHYVDLPQLNELSLHGPSKPCFDIFKHLTTPPACRLLLHCIEDKEDVMEVVPITEILPALTAHFGTTRSCLPFDLLVLSNPLEGQYQVHAWRSNPDLGGFFSEEPADLSILLPFSAQPQDSLSALCDSLPLETIRTINVMADGPTPCLTAAAWQKILGRCTEVRQARLEGSSDAITFSAALGPSSLASLSQSTPILLEKLEHLSIEGVDFSASGPVEGIHSRYFELLSQQLVQRQKIPGLPRISLAIADCTIRLEWVMDLGKVVSVTWDSVTEGRQDTSDDEDQDDEDEDDEGQDQDDEEQDQGDEDQDGEGESDGSI